MTRFAFFLFLVGCVPQLGDGRFTCRVDGDCPSGFTCRASDMLCYRGAASDGAVSDGGVSPDAPSIDASLDAPAIDAAAPIDASADAPTGCGTNCIQVIVLNADPSASGNIEWTDTNHMMQHIGIPPYGQTTATTDVPNVPVGANWSVFVPPSVTSIHDLPIPIATRYVLVLGPSSFGASVLLLQQPIVPLHTGNYVYLNVLDLTDDIPGLLLSGAGRDAPAQAHRNMVSAGGSVMMLPFLPSAPGALRVELAGTSAPPLLGALLDEQISASEGTYWMVIAGSVQRHLADPGSVGLPGGLRFISGLPSSMAQTSTRIVHFVNALTTMATVCDGTNRLETLPLATLSSTAYVPPSAAAWTLTVHAGPDCSTGTTHDVTVTPALGRTLVSIAGDTTAAWTAVAIAEPIPSAGIAQTIVIHNALTTSSDIAGASGIASLGTSSASVTTIPTSLTATTGAGTKMFHWSPAARQAWLVMTQQGAGSFKAFEIDSPYDAPWHLDIAPGS